MAAKTRQPDTPQSTTPPAGAPRPRRAAWRRTPRDPFAITAPVDPTYRYRHTETPYVHPSSTDLCRAILGDMDER
jgi:hypothetical protein